jgi:hypothetical protein
MIRDAIALAEVLRVATPPHGEYAIVTTNAARAEAAARLKSEGYLEVRGEAPDATQLGLRLTPLGLAARTKLQGVLGRLAPLSLGTPPDPDST